MFNETSADFGSIELTAAQVKAGVFTAPALVGDLTLEAVFKDAPPVESEEGYHVSGTVTDENGKPLPGVTVDIGGQTDVTDEDGKFTVEDVPPGTHPAVVTDKDDEVIGLGKITIGTPDGSDFTVTEDENGNLVIKPDGDTAVIDLTLEIGSDGDISIENVRDATEQPSKPGAPPQTGDGGLFLYALLTAAGTGLMILIIARGKKRRKV